MGELTRILIILPILFLSVPIIGLAVMGPQRRVWIQHQQSGLSKKGYVGYCWTYFFFGWLVPVFRGEIFVGVLHLILTSVTLGFFHIVMPFLYNKQFMTRQLTSGWQLCDDEGVMAEARLQLKLARNAGGARNDYPIEPYLGGSE